MSEIINIFVGQCGVQLGSQFWELFCEEHEINQSGQKIQSDNTQILQNENISPFFHEVSPSKFQPRALLVDLDPTTIDEVRTNSFKNLFNQNMLISGMEDASSNHTRGYYTLGKEIIDVCMDQLRKLSENCDNFQGFLLYGSTSGGTAGVTSNFLDRIKTDFGWKKRVIYNSVVSSKQMSNSTVEPYNTVLSLFNVVQSADAIIMYQNQALYNICSSQLGLDSPNYANINRLIAQTISSYTSSIRFRGSLNVNIEETLINLIPYPKMMYIIPSYAPFDSEIDRTQNISVKSITKSIFSNENSFLQCNFKNGAFMACSYSLRGDVIPKDVIESVYIEKSNKTIRFVDWCPTGFKIGVNPSKPCSLIKGEESNIPIDGCMLSNTSSASEWFNQISFKFDILYAKRAFVHWFVGEGMESGEFAEAREEIAYIEKNFEEICSDTVYQVNDDDY